MNYHRALHRFRHPNRGHRAQRPTRAPLRHLLECLESRELLSVSPLQPEANPLVTPHLITQAITGPVQPADGGGSAPYSPAQMLKVYGTDQVYFSSGFAGLLKGDGWGKTIAIVDAYDHPTIFSDADTFDSTFAVNASDPTSLYSEYGPSSSWLTKATPGGVPSYDPGWAGEISLDVEWAHAIAPAAHILLVEAPSNGLDDLLNAVDYARSQLGVVTVSMSWGSGEFASENSSDNHFTTPSGHDGVTFVASSGDAHSVSYPAASPNVLSVGGTTLTLNPDGSYGSETAWSSSGGGVSAYEPKPAYQYYVPYGMRSTPDIAYNADPATGVCVYDSSSGGGMVHLRGDQRRAPQMAALIAIADQGRNLNGLGSLDGPNQTLPATNATLPFPGDFNAIVGEPAYSLYTGWGSPVANNLVSDLAGGWYAAIGAPVAAPTAAATGNVLVGGAGTDLQTDGGGGHGVLIGVNDTATRGSGPADAIGIVASPDLFDAALTSLLFDGGLCKDGSFLRNHR